jgi:hypothetical protein
MDSPHRARFTPVPLATALLVGLTLLAACGRKGSAGRGEARPSPCPNPAETLCGGPPLPELAGDPRWQPTRCADLATDRDNCGACSLSCPAGQRCEGGTCTATGLAAERREACALLQGEVAAALPAVRDYLCGDALPSCWGKDEAACGAAPACVPLMTSSGADCTEEGVCRCSSGACVPDVVYRGCSRAGKTFLARAVKAAALCLRSGGRWGPLQPAQGNGCRCGDDRVNPEQLTADRGCVAAAVVCVEQGLEWHQAEADGGDGDRSRCLPKGRAW